MGAAIKRIVMNRIKSKVADKVGSDSPFGTPDLGMPERVYSDRDQPKLDQFKSLATDPMQFVKNRFIDRLEGRREAAAGVLNPQRFIRTRLVDEGLDPEDIDSILSTMNFKRNGEEITQTPGVSRGILG